MGGFSLDRFLVKKKLATSTDRLGPPNGGGGLVREMGARQFQGNRSVGEILFHLAPDRFISWIWKPGLKTSLLK